MVCRLADFVDFVCCLGGDGVILHASALFRASIPPVLSFHLGSMGFLTNHLYNDYKKALREVGRGAVGLHSGREVMDARVSGHVELKALGRIMGQDMYVVEECGAVVDGCACIYIMMSICGSLLLVYHCRPLGLCPASHCSPAAHLL